MSLRAKIDLVYNNRYANTDDSTQNNRNLKATLLKMMSTIATGTYDGVTYNKYKGTSVISGQTNVYENYTVANIIDDEATSGANTFTLQVEKEEVTGLDHFKMHMDSVANQVNGGALGSGFGNSVRMYYSSSSYSSVNVDLFKQVFGNYIMFDFLNFNETVQSSTKNKFLGCYDSLDNFITPAHAIALRFLGEHNLHVPILPYTAPNATQYGTGNSEFIACCNMTQRAITQSGNVTPDNVSVLQTVVAMYCAIKNNVDPLTNNIYTLMGNSMIRCTNSSGNYSFYIVEKDIIDELLTDLIDVTSISITYSGNIPSPTPPGPTPGEGIPTEPGQPDNDIDNQGGTGEWEIQEIDKPQVPGAGASFFSNTYLLNYTQLKSLSNMFFSDNAISALLTGASNSEILSAFRGAMLWPFDFDDIDVPYTTANYIKMGTLSVGDGSTTFAEINALTTVEIDFGTLTIPNRYGGFLDYHPFTQMSIWLPFCGFKDIDPADVYGHTLHLYYLADIESGAGKACIDIDDIPMLEYPCQLGIPISFNANDMYEKARNAVLGIVNSFTGASTQGRIEVNKDDDGNVSNIGSNPTGAVTHLMGGLASTAINTAMTKVNFTSMGGVGNGVERQQPMQAYIITKTINTAVPDNYNQLVGRPSLMVKQLNEEVGKGFTTVINPQLELDCTEEEKAYITNALQKGVYL